MQPYPQLGQYMTELNQLLNLPGKVTTYKIKSEVYKWENKIGY